MTDKYVFNPDIHEDWTPPAHRCGNCAHHEHEAVMIESIAVVANDGSRKTESIEGTHCYCTHDGKHFITGDNDHCDYWEAEE